MTAGANLVARHRTASQAVSEPGLELHGATRVTFSSTSLVPQFEGRHMSAQLNRSMRYLRVADTQPLKATAMNRSGVSVTRLTCPGGGLGPTDPHALESAVMISLQLQEYQGELWRNGRWIPMGTWHAGEFSAYDYRDRWKANLLSAFDCINFHIPMGAFDAASLGLRHAVEHLNVAPGQSIGDPIVDGLARALAQAATSPQTTSRLFTDHVELALLTHLATRYGSSSIDARRASGGLDPVTLNRAKELLSADLSGQLPIAELAAACGVSSGYLIRAFRTSTGLPPYKWLQRRRVEVAMEQLSGTAQPMSRIAFLCGFADQSHFTRVFQGIVGMTPGAYRRLHGPGSAARG